MPKESIEFNFDNRDFTRASDFIRQVGGLQENGISPKLSRSDASRIRMELSGILGLDDLVVTKKIADHYRSLGNL